MLVAIGPAATAADGQPEVPLVKPVRTWEGCFERDLPAHGPRTVHVIADAEGWEVVWRILRGEAKVPAADFQQHFVVLVLYPGGQFTLEGLRVDPRGAAKVRGLGIDWPVNEPKGRWYVLAVFPRGKVKGVEGRKVPAPE